MSRHRRARPSLGVGRVNAKKSPDNGPCRATEGPDHVSVSMLRVYSTVKGAKSRPAHGAEDATRSCRRHVQWDRGGCARSSNLCDAKKSRPRGGAHCPSALQQGGLDRRPTMVEGQVASAVDLQAHEKKRKTNTPCSRRRLVQATWLCTAGLRHPYNPFVFHYFAWRRPLEWRILPSPSA